MSLTFMEAIEKDEKYNMDLVVWKLLTVKQQRWLYDHHQHKKWMSGVVKEINDLDIHKTKKR